MMWFIPEEQSITHHAFCSQIAQDCSEFIFPPPRLCHTARGSFVFSGDRGQKDRSANFAVGKVISCRGQRGSIYWAKQFKTRLLDDCAAIRGARPCQSVGRSAHPPCTGPGAYGTSTSPPPDFLGLPLCSNALWWSLFIPCACAGVCRSLLLPPSWALPSLRHSSLACSNATKRSSPYTWAGCWAAV